MRLEKRLSDLERTTVSDFPAIIVFWKECSGGHGRPIAKRTSGATLVGAGNVWRGNDEPEADFDLRVYASQITGEIQPIMPRNDLDRVVAVWSKRADKELQETGGVSYETYETLAHKVSSTEAMERRRSN